jgi:radical SAM superfamily enzyme YgiQ (UPF0313 family)
MGNKGKVFLIYPPSPVLNREDRCQQPTEDLLVIPPLPPTDLMYLAAIAESCGFEAKIKDYSQGGDFIKELKEFQPHFLVVNIATPTFISDMDWVRKAKEALPGLCTIVKGAPFLTYNANAIYENTFLDYVIGLPWETEETVEETIKFAIELDSNFISFYTATPLPGTKFFAKVESPFPVKVKNIRPEKEVPDIIFFNTFFDFCNNVFSRSNSNFWT